MESVNWNPDGSRLVTGNVGGSIYVWDALTLQPLATLIANSSFDPLGITNPVNSWVLDVAFSADGQEIFAISADGTVKVWDTNSFQELATAQVEPLDAAAWSPDGTQLAKILSTGAVAFEDTSNLVVTCDTTIPASDVTALISAITTGNGFGAPYTLCLAAGITYTLTAVNNTSHGSNGLPLITGDITIVGNGATITRNSTAPVFRIATVETGAALTLDD